MPIPKLSLTGLRWLPAVVLALLLAGGGGWWLGRRTAPRTPAGDPRRQELGREADRLRGRLDRGVASDDERQRLLELLVGLERKSEAIALLEPIADREPDRWALRLMLAELRRDGGDRSGAERELRQVLARHPLQQESQQLLSLLLLESGRGSEAEQRVKSAYETATLSSSLRPEGLGLGLLLAEIQQQRGERPAAQATLTRLAGQFPTDQRPLLALALMRRDGGDTKGALEALALARQRNPQPDRRDAKLLDQLAAGWGLSTVRGPAAAKPATPQPATPAPRTP